MLSSGKLQHSLSPWILVVLDTNELLVPVVVATAKSVGSASTPRTRNCTTSVPATARSAPSSR
jgi:hypothetical protein